MLLRLFEAALCTEDVGKVEVRFFVVGLELERGLILDESLVFESHSAQNSAEAAMRGRVLGVGSDGSLHHARRDVEVARLLCDEPESVEALGVPDVDRKNVEI